MVRGDDSKGPLVTNTGGRTGALVVRLRVFVAREVITGMVGGARAGDTPGGDGGWAKPCTNPFAATANDRILQEALTVFIHRMIIVVACQRNDEQKLSPLSA